MELKKIELDMFRHFLEICHKHQLKYFLIGGSCLGSVRHQGFIPWDDDIDIGMPRDDYESFLSIAPRELPEYLFLQTTKTDPEYPNNFAKIRNSMTTFIETSVKDFVMNHGVYLDIFPIDGYRMSKGEKLRNKIYTTRMVVEFLAREKQMSTIKRVGIKVIRILNPNWKRARDRRDDLIKKNKYNQCDMVANFCGAWGKKEIMPKSYFGEGVTVTFEGIDVIIPEQYDMYLKQLYGNYMQFPPEQDRASHHYCEVVDLLNSYTNYMP